MAKANYSAWRINTHDFSARLSDIEKLQFFARYAVLAPSGHNTQPWRFSQTKDTLVLGADYSRRLPYSGIQANEPYVSLGACLGILQLAAEGFGYSLNIRYVMSDDAVAHITLGKEIPADPSLLSAIKHRVSNRSFYDTANLPDDIIKTVTGTDLDDVSTFVISDKEDIEYIAEQTTISTLTTMGDKEFRAELSKWVRNNVTRQYDGMPGFVQGIPTPVSMLAKHVIKRVDVSKDQAKKDSNRILNSANLILVLVNTPGEKALLNAGRLYSTICVKAEQNGLATAGAGSAIIDPDTKKDIVKRFNLAGQPIAIIRLGKASKKAKHTPRWPLAKISS